MYKYLFSPSRYIKRGAFLMILVLAVQLVSPLFTQTVNASSDLSVDIFANPSSGPAPLNDVDLVAEVSGTATGDITYKFDCTNNGTWEDTITTGSTPYTSVDLCDYPAPGNYTAKVLVERDNLTFEGTTAIFVSDGPELSVNLFASPYSGDAPLNDVDLTADVSGSATGDITYKFDCRNDGTWEDTITTGNTSYTSTDLCDYPDPGNYTAAVQVERDGLSFKGTTAIFAREPLTLFVDLTADPSSGYAPLEEVDLIADVSGTASGDIVYWFDCTNNGSWEHNVATSSDPYTAIDLCDYSEPGTYIAKVRVERQGLTAEDTTEILVEEIATLHLSITAVPSSGHAPLNDVDLVADVSGTASGDITYRFDCTNNGSWDRTITTSDTSYTATDLCDYSSPGLYAVRILAERGGLQIQGTIDIVIGDIATLAVDFSTSPSSGEEPLNNVDLTVYVSGTATGDITYYFDCTNNGSWEDTITTGNSSYTAHDLCDYSTDGLYTAKVKVERGGVWVQGTAKILVTED